MELLVKGHSGFDIDIAREGTDLYVYKHCQGKDLADRLMRQATKQQKATTHRYTGFQIPPILSVSNTTDSTSIKMNYVYSRNFMEYFESAGFEQIEFFIHTIIQFIEEELALSPMQSLPAAVVTNKFASVEKTINANPYITPSEQLTNVLEQAKLLLKKDTNWQLPVGICHGDLTFSNILFTANTYYLIDFLDSFIESPLLDIIKLRQDSAHIWSAMLYTKPYDPIRLQIICHKIDSELDTYFQKYTWYNENYLPLQVLNLLRVLQYAKEEHIIHHLLTELSKLLYAV